MFLYKIYCFFDPLPVFNDIISYYLIHIFKCWVEMGKLQFNPFHRNHSLMNFFESNNQNECAPQIPKPQVIQPLASSQNVQQNTFFNFLRKNIAKILFLMVTIYLCLHLYTSNYYKQSFVTFEKRNVPQNNKKGQTKHQDQTQFLDQNLNDAEKQKRTFIQPQSTPPINKKKAQQNEVSENDLTTEKVELLKEKYQKQNTPALKITQSAQQIQKQSDLIESPQPSLPNNYNLEQEYFRLIRSLLQEKNQQRKYKKEQLINQIYINLNDKHRSSLHAHTDTELQQTIRKFIAHNKQSELPLRLTLQNNQLNPSRTALDNEYVAKLSQRYNFENANEGQMCIILCTRNNAFNKQILRSLNSIYNQQYTHYQVVIADRASTDQTYSIIEQYLQASQPILSRTTLIQTNQESEVYALWSAAQSCKQDSTAVYLDGNTELVGKQVLRILNFQFSQSHPKIVYGDGLQLDLSRSMISLHSAKAYDQSQMFMLLYRNLGNKFGKMIGFKTNSVTSISEKYIKFNGEYFSYSGIESLVVSLLQISCAKIKTVSLPLSFSLADSQIQKRQERQKKHELSQISSKLKLDVC